MRKVVFISKGLNDNEASGIQRNTYEILKCIDKYADADIQIQLLVPSWEQQSYLFKNIEIVKVGHDFSCLGKIGSRINRYIYKNIDTWRYIKKEKAFSVDMLLFVPWYGCDIITIYDCIPELFPNNYITASEQRSRRKRIAHQERAVRKAKLILTDSENAKKDIERFYNTRGKDIIVIPCAWQHFLKVRQDEKVLDKLCLREKEYFFSLGNLFPHKNIKWILCAAKQNPQYTFVITGRAPMKEQQLESDQGKEKNIIFTGRLTDEEIKALMKHCKAFIHPSLYEGFGIPPMEAMSIGADCIISNAASLPEIYKESAWYINPSEYDNIDLDKIMSGHKEGNEKVLSAYSWEKSAKMLYETIKKQACK